VNRSADLVEAVFPTRGMAMFRSQKALPPASTSWLTLARSAWTRLRAGQDRQRRVRVVRELQGVLGRLGADQGLVMA
jgi:hypothetical protein